MLKRMQNGLQCEIVCPDGRGYENVDPPLCFGDENCRGLVFRKSVEIVARRKKKPAQKRSSTGTWLGSASAPPASRATCHRPQATDHQPRERPTGPKCKTLFPDGQGCKNIETPLHFGDKNCWGIVSPKILTKSALARKNGSKTQ